MSDIQAGTSDFDAKMNGAAFGDRLILANGQYRRNFANLKSGVEFQAANRWGVEFICDGSNTVFRQPDGARNKFRECLFRGGAFDFAGRSRLDLDWCKFVEFSRGANPGAGQALRSGTHGGGWISDGSIITNNLFEDMTNGNGWAIGAGQLVNSIFRFNRFACWNGIKSDAFQGFHSNTYIEQNDFDGMGRMGTELQGRGERIYFQHNYFRNPRYPGRNDSCLGWSNILHGRDQHDLFYRYCTMDARDDGGENYTRLMFEAGNATTIEHNLCLNVGTVTSLFIGDSSGPQPENVIIDSFVRNNKIVKSRYGIGGAYGQYPQKARYSNNGPDVQLPADIKGIGVIPGPGKDITAGTTFPPASLTLTAQPQPATPEIMTEGARVKFTIADVPALAKSVRIESRAKGQAGVSGPQVGPAPTIDLANFPATVGLYHPGWELDFRAVALDATGKELAASEWQAAPRMAGEIGPNGSGLAWPPSGEPPPPPPPLGVTTNHTLQRVLTDDELSALISLRFSNKPVAVNVSFKVTAPAGDRKVQMVD